MAKSLLRFKVLVLSLFLTSLNQSHSSPTSCLTLGDETVAFLKSMPGDWQGYAPITPLGKLPYDIKFQSKRGNLIEGVSKTNGQAIHTWKFNFSLGKLILDFHSTFGNSHAKGLCVTKYSNERGYFFSNGKPSSLSLWVKTRKENLKLKWEAEIYLKNKPHVLISVEKTVSSI